MRGTFSTTWRSTVLVTGSTTAVITRPLSRVHQAIIGLQGELTIQLGVPWDFACADLLCMSYYIIQSKSHITYYIYIYNTIHRMVISSKFRKSNPAKVPDPLPPWRGPGTSPGLQGAAKLLLVGGLHFVGGCYFGC